MVHVLLPVVGRIYQYVPDTYTGIPGMVGDDTKIASILGIQKIATEKNGGKNSPCRP